MCGRIGCQRFSSRPPVPPHQRHRDHLACRLPGAARRAKRTLVTMTLVDYVHVLRQRWKLIVAAVVLVAAIAFLTAPSAGGSGVVVNHAGYTATATLMQDPNSQTQVNLP